MYHVCVQTNEKKISSNYFANLDSVFIWLDGLVAGVLLENIAAIEMWRGREKLTIYRNDGNYLLQQNDLYDFKRFEQKIYEMFAFKEQCSSPKII